MSLQYESKSKVTMYRSQEYFQRLKKKEISLYAGKKTSTAVIGIDYISSLQKKYWNLYTDLSKQLFPPGREPGGAIW